MHICMYVHNNKSIYCYNMYVVETPADLSFTCVAMEQPTDP